MMAHWMIAQGRSSRFTTDLLSSVHGPNKDAGNKAPTGRRLEMVADKDGTFEIVSEKEDDDVDERGDKSE